MANALARETSPYLLQHRDNPVDWMPWGEEALGRAREQDRPLLVSIGYSACHWCHVMERESFEDAETAALMNEHFVCVKVDREERPDVDAIYMEAVQAMTGHGGWPLNMFVTPEQVPFFGGTYFPPEPRHGMPSWRQVLLAVVDAWNNRRDEIRASSGQVVERLKGGALLAPSTEPIQESSLDEAVANARASYDPVNGGFARAPKFPPASTIELLLRRGEREMSLHTLRSMAAGGINDQVGGGFSRYAVDTTWTVPHFEKMLYDNALLARAYLHGWQVSGEEVLRRTCCETLDWALREMRSPAEDGGLFTPRWTPTPRAWRASSTSGRPRSCGTHSATTRKRRSRTSARRTRATSRAPTCWRRAAPEPANREDIRARLLEVRAERVRPGLDDKRLTAWNALMISALAEAGAVLERDDYLAAARGAADFVLREMRDAEGRLLRTFNAGEAKLLAYLEDHGFLLEALLTLYEATFEPRWFKEARALADQTIARFADPDRGGFFSTPVDGEQLVTRRKDLEDTPIPSGSSATAFGLLRLAALTGEHDYERHAVGALRLLHQIAPRHPVAFGHLLQAIDFYLAPVKEVALVGEDVEPLARVVRSEFRPHLVLAGGDADGVPLLEGRTPVDGSAAAYVCERFVCQRPVTDPAELEELLT